jgi:hypothetical protein
MSLTLKDNQVGPAGATCVAAALRLCTGLVDLNFSSLAPPPYDLT